MLSGNNAFIKTTAPVSDEPSDGVLRKIARSLGNKAWGTDAVATAATGTNYAQLASHKAISVEIHNHSGQSINLRNKVLAGTPILIPTATVVTIPVKGNSNEIEVKRADDSNTPVSVGFLWRNG